MRDENILVKGSDFKRCSDETDLELKLYLGHKCYRVTQKIHKQNSIHNYKNNSMPNYYSTSSSRQFRDLGSDQEERKNNSNTNSYFLVALTVLSKNKEINIARSRNY